MTLHLWVNHQASDKMRKEKVLKNRKKTEEEDEFNGLGRKKDGRKKKQIQEAKKKALSDHRWQSGDKDKIKVYMSRHQHDADAQELWQYFQEVIAWIQRTFPQYRSKIMKDLDWGRFYNEHKGDKLNAATLEDRIVSLIDDDEVDSKKGIYEYLLTGNEKTLSLRAFDEKTKVKIYEKQKGVCPECKKHYDIGAMEADHIIPWSQGGKTVPDNCHMLCKLDNRTKSGN